MLVGIMSMQRIINFGSVMQALSLKSMIEELGCRVVFVDYKLESCIEKDRGTLKGRIKASPLGRKLTALKYRYKRKSYKNRQLKLQRYAGIYKMLGLDEKPHYRTRVDVLVIGSDEVFNCTQSNKDVGFSQELFGKNNRAKRLISYAASFGFTRYEDLVGYGIDKVIAERLRSFDSISVRDENSENIVYKLTDHHPQSHLDPVLVGDLETREWRMPDIEQDSYIAVYGYGRRFTDDEGKAINAFAKREGLKTIAVFGRADFCDEFIECLPEEIFGYFKKAKYIVTETFHGAIFSMILHKTFVVFDRKKSRINITNHEKLYDMLQKMGLTDRIVNDLSELGSVMKQPIDFSAVDKKRKAERERTMQYLKENILEQ